MSRLLSALLASAAFGLAANAHAAIVNDVYTEYTVTYDDSTLLSGIDFSFGSSSSVGFGWNIPSTVSVTGGEIYVPLPSFTVTANAGFTLGGFVSSSIGNLSFVETGEAGATFAAMGGALSINGDSPFAFAVPLVRTPVLSVPGLTTGFYSLSDSATLPPTFTSFTVTDLVLVIAATEGSAIFSTEQPELKFEFSAAPVPEADTYAMLLAGLGLVSMVARRRMSR